MEDSTTINELTTVDREKLVKMFDKLKKGSTVKIKSNDSIKKGDDYIEFVVKSKSTVRRGEVEKITLANKGNPTGVKRFLYKRVDTSMVSFAVGDMAASIVDIKESVDEASILKTVHKNVTNKKSAEKDRKKAVKTMKDIRKGKYAGVKMANEDDDPCWDTHKKVGTKMKGGKRVNDCVPKEAKTGLPTGQSTVDYENSIQKLMKTLKKDPKNRGKSGNELRKLATFKLTGHKLKESVLEETMLNEFSDAQLAQLKKAYANLDRIDPTSPTYKKLKAMIAKMDAKALEKIARAKVKFVSQIAAREYEVKSGNRLKAKDYMESTELEEKGKGLWHNIRKKRERGEPKAKPGDKDYPKTLNIESTELDEAIDFRKAFMDIQSYAKKSGGIDKTDFEKVAYYVKAIGDNQNTPNVANKAFMLMKKHIAGLDTDVRDGIHVLLKKHGMVKNGRMVQESITEGALGKQWVNGAKRVKSGSITLVKAKNPDADLHTVMKNGKKVGTFVFDDGPDAFSVTNMSTKKVSWADQIDDIPKMFESKAPALKSSDYAKGTYQSAQAFKDKFAKKKKAPALKSSDYPKGTSMSATAWKKKHESVDEASKEGTVRIIDLGNKGQDKIRKELGVDKLPNKGFQVQVMTKGKFVNQGKPYKTMKDAEKVRSTGQHSMQFDEAALEEKTKWKMGDGRPRNGPRIENDRFWNLPYDSLKYIAKDAGDAMRANPTARKATTGPGNWADQVADAATVMQWRKKNGIKESKKFSGLR
jgi:hypothetical protein